jgi:hypothetical protein
MRPGRAKTPGPFLPICLRITSSRESRTAETSFFGEARRFGNVIDQLRFGKGLSLFAGGHDVAPVNGNYSVKRRNRPDSRAQTTECKAYIWKRGNMMRYLVLVLLFVWDL